MPPSGLRRGCRRPDPIGRAGRPFVESDGRRAAPVPAPPGGPSPRPAPPRNGPDPETARKRRLPARCVPGGQWWEVLRAGTSGQSLCTAPAWRTQAACGAKSVVRLGGSG
nr:hypothetical protein KPHV_30810 [Kitasatospora purpeofusca]